MSESKDVFGDRMKAKEKAFTDAKISTDEILCVRIDGKRFSKFTSSFAKPYDSRISDSMRETTSLLVKEFNARVGYVQSDEITLLFSPGEKESEYIFGGKASKINSILASAATAFFNRALDRVTEGDRYPAFFDCRAWAVERYEASNVLLWRVQDAIRNSKSCIYRWTFGHKAMAGKSGDQMVQELCAEGSHKKWDQYDDSDRFGSLIYSIPHMIETGAIRPKYVVESARNFWESPFIERDDFISNCFREEKEHVSTEV
jgi:tRNA(His) guanylyltransferase